MYINMKIITYFIFIQIFTYFQYLKLYFIKENKIYEQKNQDIFPDTIETLKTRENGSICQL